MSRRGYSETKAKPDLLFRYEIVANTRTESTVNNTSFYSVPTVNTRTFLESALLIDLKQRDNKKLVWQASIDMRQHTRKSKNKDPLSDAIKQLFTTYAYRAGSKSPDPTLTE